METWCHILSRILSHLEEDIAKLTRYNKEVARRLCFLLGARKAIQLMIAVRDAPEYVYLVLNQTTKEKSMDQVFKKVEKEIEIQGYKFDRKEDLGDIIAVKITDRKLEVEEKILKNPELKETLVNKFNAEHVKNEEIPTVIVKRSASIAASKGESILTGDIQNKGKINTQDNVVIMNLENEIVAHGIAEMSSEEIDRSPGRIAIRTLEGRFDMFREQDQKRYKNGLYYETTLPRILAMNILKFKKNKPANLLVICRDNGEIAVSLSKKMAEGSRVAILAKDQAHKLAINRTFERMDVDPDKFQLIELILDRYAKSRPRYKFTHFFVEFQSSETGIRPNPFFNTEEKDIINNVRSALSGLRSLPLIGENEAQIVFVSHSLDPSENQEIVIQSFRQGYFSPLILRDDLREEFSSDIHVLPEIPTMAQSTGMDINKIRMEEGFKSCWINVDPILHKSHAGFVAYFELLTEKSKVQSRGF
jgi:hypothetical protein